MKKFWAKKIERGKCLKKPRSIEPDILLVCSTQCYIAIFIINIINKNIPNAINGYLSNMIYSPDS